MPTDEERIMAALEKLIRQAERSRPSQMELRRRRCVRNFDRLERGLEIGINVTSLGVAPLMKKLFGF